jgi:glycosyltransferase involved in cell wall biosynthesis
MTSDGPVAHAPVGLSVVVPCLDEERNLEALLASLDALRPALDERYTDFEVVLVDDGSTDGTFDLMTAAAAHDPRVRYLALSRNFGKESAMLAGLSRARGSVVALLDADLQHPPELLLEMLPLLDQGYDQVVAQRTRAGDPRSRAWLSRGFYRVMNALSEVRLEDGVGDFRVLSRKAVRALLSLDEHNRFSKGLFSWIGYPTATVRYENVGRTDGASRWRFGSLLSYGVDGLLSFDFRPMRAVLWFGASVTLVALGYAFWILGRAMLVGVDVPGYVTLVCTVVGLAGVQLVVLGVIGEYLGRIYLEVKRRPHFLVRASSDDQMETQTSTE